MEWPTLPNGYRFLETGEDAQQGDLYFIEDHGWEVADPSITSKDFPIIRKLNNSRSIH